MHAGVETVFRREHGRIIATLVRISGSFDLAEEAMQDAFAVALQEWTARGVPDSPAGWITTTARRKLIDVVRRERTRTKHADAVLVMQEGHMADNDGMPADPDDLLRLIFTCCHPALNPEAQVALRRPDHARNRARVPRVGIDPCATPGTGQAQDRRCPHSIRGAEG
jgi:RNA polymerase sigma-70 factor (ECF subfamily)